MPLDLLVDIWRSSRFLHDPLSFTLFDEKCAEIFKY
jgi:hypothetical protein